MGSLSRDKELTVKETEGYHWDHEETDNQPNQEKMNQFVLEHPGSHRRIPPFSELIVRPLTSEVDNQGKVSLIPHFL